MSALSPLPTLSAIEDKCKDIFGKTPCQFQSLLCLWQLQQKNIISISPTGSGKTLTFWLPLLFSPTSIIIIITALNVLGDQFVAQLREVGFPAVAVTASNDNDITFSVSVVISKFGKSIHVFAIYQNIRSGQFRVVIFNPETVTKRNGRCDKYLWNYAPFITKVLNVIFDEGHCISQWGDTFREDYSQVGKLRWFLPNTPFYVTSATLPTAVLQDVKQKLQMPETTSIMRRSNDRWNIVYAVREMKYHQSTYADLGFLIPVDWQTGNNPIPAKFLVFFNSKREAEEAAKFLKSRLPFELRDRVHWLHSGMTAAFRTDEIKNMVEGEQWGLLLTDIGGMVSRTSSGKASVLPCH